MPTYDNEINEDYIKVTYGLLNWKKFLKKYFHQEKAIIVYAEGLVNNYVKSHPIPSKRISTSSLKIWLKPMRDFLNSLEKNNTPIGTEATNELFKFMVRRFAMSFERDFVNEAYNDFLDKEDE